MAEQLKFFTVFSLKEISLRRVAAALRSNADISACISRFHVTQFDTEEGRVDCLRAAEDIVMEDEVSKLEMPESIKKEMVEAARPIGLEVERWKHFHEGDSSDEEKIRLPDAVQLYWTTAGLIDYRKTAEELVRRDEILVKHRYRLACLNCLEDDIPLIWEKLTEEDKASFVCVGGPWPELTTCWPYIIRGQLSELDYLLARSDRNLTSFNQWAFERSAMSGNKVATKHFFQYLTHGERESSLIRTIVAVLDNGTSNLPFRNVNLSDVVCYLLTLLTPRQQLETIWARPSGSLLNFFFCPSQDLFLSNARLLWSFVPASDYLYLAGEMFSRYRKLRFDFPKIFREFFVQSPPDFKEILVDEEIGQDLAFTCLRLFLRRRDLESIEAMFRGTDAADRAKFVFTPYVLSVFCHFVSNSAWPLVEKCLREASLSAEEKKRMKDALKDLLESDESGGVVIREFERCFELFDGTAAKKEA